MSLKKIFVLLKKEFKQGAKSFIFIWAIISPILLTFIISILMGMFIARTPVLGIYAQTPSSVVTELKNTKALKVVEFNSENNLVNAVKEGSVDVGIVLPPNFDNLIKEGKTTVIKSYIFGESYARNRAIIATTFGYVVRSLSPAKVNINIETENIGPHEIPIKDRVFPLIVMVSIFFGGFLIPSFSIVEEKRKRTIEALRVASTSSTEIIFSKLLIGFIVSLFSSIFTLAINRVFTSNPVWLLVILTLGALMASLIGVIIGILVKDYSTLLTIWKGFGILLFLPALNYMFPQIPPIIGKFVPTYYVIAPIIDVISGRATNYSLFANAVGAIVVNLILGLLVLSYAKRIEELSFYVNEK